MVTCLIIKKRTCRGRSGTEEHAVCDSLLCPTCFNNVMRTRLHRTIRILRGEKAHLREIYHVLSGVFHDEEVMTAEAR